MNWAEFLAMGGYAAYVWPAYGLALVVLVVTWGLPHWRERRLLRALGQRAAGGRS
ncbi:MAG: heme exporter protein CcmD [Proteobacteria bacterium SW_6_67_9]|nr:MAG: heme exporter protein CcmD [Proteobacteria bacterium SW_6_67_9]